MKKFTPLFVSLLLAGCSGLLSPETKTIDTTKQLGKIQSETSNYGTRVAVETPPISPTIHGNNNTLELTVPQMQSAATYTNVSLGGAQTTRVDDNSSTSTFPLGTKLILIGVGCAILLVVAIVAWKYIKNTSVGAGIRLGDAALGRLIDHANNSLAESTDASLNMKLTTLKASMEKERGKLNSSTKK